MRGRFPLPLLPFLVAAGVHLGALRGGFHFDDFHSIVGNKALRDVRNIPRFFTDPSLYSSSPEGAMVRPVVLTVHAINGAQSGGSDSALPWLATNLLLHAAASAALFALVRAALRRCGAERPEGNALLASLLFAVHPLACEVVNYVSARSSSLSGLFILLALLSHVRLRDAAPWTLAGPLALASLAMLSRETAVVLPVLVGVVESFLPGRFRARAARTFSYVALAAAFLVLRSALVPAAPLPGTGRVEFDPGAGWGRSNETNLLLQTLATARFLGLFLWPAGLSVDHAFPEISGPGDGRFLLAAAALLLAVAGAFRLRRRALSRLGFALVACGVAPYFAVPLNVVFAEHRTYLALAGAALVLADAAAWLAPKFRAPRGLRSGLACAALLALAGRTAVRDADWKRGADDLPLWESALRVSPDSFRARLAAGNILFERGDLGAAERHYREALRVYPLFDAARLSLATALAQRGDLTGLDEAISLLEEVLGRRSSHVLARFKLAWALEQRFLRTRDAADARRCDETLRSLANENPADGTAAGILRRFAAERGGG